jgi:hypothetical protein
MHRLVTSMSALCSEMCGSISEYSTTEVAAFCEASRQMDFCTQGLADGVVDYLAAKSDRIGQLTGEELPGVLWVVSKKVDVDLTLAGDLCEAVHKQLDDLRTEDLVGGRLRALLILLLHLGPFSHLAVLLPAQSDARTQPKLVPLVATLCPALPFTLTAISDNILEQLDSFSAEEITSLSVACECTALCPSSSPSLMRTASSSLLAPSCPADGSEVVRRSIFDDAIFKKLADSCIRRAPEFSIAELKTVLEVYREIAQRHHNLFSTLAKLEAELVPLTSPTPQ